MIPKKLSPAIFGIALICFFLPWINVSCQGQKVMSFSGIQLVTGTTIEEPTMFGPAQKRKVKSEAFALLTFLSAIAGLVLSLMKNKKGTIGTIVSGCAGIVLLLMLESKLDSDIKKETAGMLQLNYDIGFYLTLVLFIAVAGINAYSIMRYKGMTLPQINNQSPSFKFCSQCGAKLHSDATFCSECGHSLK
ncbi:MAG: zinc-ribbon domain-containing protein [Thermodesulfovibrionales bacterium]